MFALKLSNITKKVSSHFRLEGISFEVPEYTIHGILGDNGAGKTTLMKILAGFQSPDEGEITVGGRKVTFSGPQAAIKAGIFMIHKPFLLAENMTVVENVIPGQEPGKNGLLDREKAHEKVAQLIAGFNLDLEPTCPVRDIPAHKRIYIEILKALYRSPHIIIIEEPTTSLPPRMKRKFFHLIESIKNQGRTILFTSRNPSEIQEIADNITVLRKGQLVDTLHSKKTGPEELLLMMTGQKPEPFKKPESHPLHVVLEAKNISLYNRQHEPVLDKISFTVRGGEVLGIAGPDENEQLEILEILTGLKQPDSGEIILHTRSGSEYSLVNKSPREIFMRGVSHIPSEKHKRGLINEYSIEDNLIMGVHFLPPFSWEYILDRKTIAQHAERMIREYDIRANSRKTPLHTLSTGDRRKILIARECFKNPELAIVVEPGEGTDFFTREFIYKKILEMRDQGKAILLFSQDFEEIMKLSDRIAIFYRNRIVSILDTNQTSLEEISQFLTGDTASYDRNSDKRFEGETRNVSTFTD